VWLPGLYKVFSNYKTVIAFSLLVIILASFSVVSPYNVLAQLQKQQSLQAAKHSSYSTLIEKGIDFIYNQGNYTEAIKYFDRVLSIDPNNIDAIFYKGAALGSLGKTSEAIPFINKAIMLSDKALAIDPNNIDVLSIKGRALNRLANYNDAIKYFDKVLAIEPKNEYALANKGVALNKLGKSSEAIKYYDKALAINPNFVYALSDKGDALSNQGNYSEAIKYYDKALHISPNYVSILENKGNIYYKKGDYVEAKRHYDKVLAIEPSNMDALNSVGLVLYYQGNRNEAIRYFDKALAINPNGIDIFEELKKQEAQQLRNVHSFSSYLSSINQSKNQHIIENINNNNASSDYTFMVYMVGSDLEAKSYSATQNIQQMENVGSNPKVNVIVETGGGSPQTTIDSKRFIDFTKVQRHKILHNGIQTLADLGTRNTGDPNTLSDFIVWGMSNFPAKKYAIILWDHGSGINGFGGDRQFNNDKLTLDEIHQAFAATTNTMNKKFELIGFDSCLMASVEVANSIRQFGNYMVASEEIEPQWGWDYSSILASLTAASNEDGSLLGKAIADSFFKRTQFLSESGGYSAQKEATMSVVNLTRIPQLVNDLDNLADYISNKITDVASENSLIQSIVFTERYGQTFKGDTGLVDIYDLSSNIKERFPQSAYLVDAFQKSLKNTIVYKANGDANSNANGLSIYIPVKEDEFTDARRHTLTSWQKVVNALYDMIKNDHQTPIIQSNATRDTIKGHIYGNDVARVTLWIYTSSMPEGNTAIYQDLDPSSFIKSDGSFEFKWNKQILSLCNDQKVQKQQNQACKPALMKLETNKNKKFALIPVRLKSNIDGIDEEVSLKYEINNGNNFTFLGARPEIEQLCQQFSQDLCQRWLQQTVSKENWPLRSSDKVSPLVYTFQSEDDNINDLSFVEYPSMQVKVGENFKPNYIYYNGTYDILFRVCDYSKNCWSTRWFHFNETETAQPQVIDLGTQKISSCKSNSNVGNNFSEYVNPLYKIKINYPSDWQKIEQGLPDANIVHLNAPGFNENGYPPAQIYLSADYWPGTYKEFLDDVTPSSTLFNPFLEVIESNSTNLGGYSAHKVLTSDRGKVILDIDSLIGHTWYSITFSSDLSKFSNYLPYAEKLIDSFHVCIGKETVNPTQTNNHTYEIKSNNNVNGFTNNTHSSKRFLVYTDPLFKMQYPSDWQIVEDNIQRQVRFYSPVGIVPNASVYDREKSRVEFMITDIGNASLLHQKGLSLEEFAKIIFNNTKGEGLGFNLYESKPITFNGNPAYKITYSYFNTKYKSAWKDTTIITILDGEVYFLEYNGELTRYERYLPIIGNMVNSFRGNILTTS
jgi:tetratricopeptide (TPR) repeat protein